MSADHQLSSASTSSRHVQKCQQACEMALTTLKTHRDPHPFLVTPCLGCSSLQTLSTILVTANIWFLANNPSPLMSGFSDRQPVNEYEDCSEKSGAFNCKSSISYIGSLASVELGSSLRAG